MSCEHKTLDYCPCVLKPVKAELIATRKRLARALWRIRRERHFADGDVLVYSENLSNALEEERHELVMRRRRGREG